MIKKSRHNVYIANKDDLCGPDIIFIRESATVLHHICEREAIEFKQGEKYLVGTVRWDYTGGAYWCDGCKTKLDLGDVWSDPELTGSESRA